MPDPLQPRYPGRPRRRLERLARQAAQHSDAREWTPLPNAAERAEITRDYLTRLAELDGDDPPHHICPACLQPLDDQPPGPAWHE